MHNKGKRRMWFDHSLCQGTGCTPWSNFQTRCDTCDGRGGWYRFVDKDDTTGLCVKGTPTNG